MAPGIGDMHLGRKRDVDGVVQIDPEISSERECSRSISNTHRTDEANDWTYGQLTERKLDGRDQIRPIQM